MQVKITGFSEDDQTNLYNMAHDACGKGRQGLGIASRPKKVFALTVALSRSICEPFSMQPGEALQHLC